jgi:hypothetical protein
MVGLRRVGNCGVAQWNYFFGWLWVFAGLLAGAIIGLFFHDERWLGGYASWRRRMLRLGHIAFVGTGLLNLAFAFSLDRLSSGAIPRLVSPLLVFGGVAMPLVCLLAAWRSAWRRVFFVPVTALVAAVALILYEYCV